MTGNDGVRQVWAMEELLPLRRVLWQWIAVLEHLLDDWKHEDWPWWYGERALVGTFAAAVWKAGGTAFEEYGAPKRDDTGLFGGQQLRRGRIDLFFSIDGLDWVAEAKQFWPMLRPETASPNVQQLTSTLEWAEDDAHASRGEAPRQLAIVFATPMVPQSNVREAPALLDEWMTVARSVPHVARASLFPLHTRRAMYNGYWYPGVTVVCRMSGAGITRARR